MNTAGFDIELQLSDTVTAPAGLEPLADALTAAATAVLQHQGLAPPAGLTILLADDEALQQLNRDFLGHDYPTDVLSFPAGNKIPDVPELAAYLGDIAISLPTAQRQADSAGHPLRSELLLLTIHGVLHLLGYDHATPAERQTMWQTQGEVLQQFGIDPTTIPALAPPDEPDEGA